MTAVLLVGMALWLPGLRSRPVAAQSAGLTGSYRYMLTTQYAGRNAGTGANMGVLAFDGAGNMTIRSTTVGVDPDPNASALQVKTGQLTGTYTVNADGTGTATVPGGAISFVITDGGSGLMLLPTAGFGNNLLTGRRESSDRMARSGYH
jgi:hypothetical protein